MDKKYFIIDSRKEKVGPYTPEELLGKLTNDTLVWCQGFTEWLNASEVSELSDFIMPEVPNVFNEEMPMSANQSRNQIGSQLKSIKKFLNLNKVKIRKGLVIYSFLTLLFFGIYGGFQAYPYMTGVIKCDKNWRYEFKSRIEKEAYDPVEFSRIASEISVPCQNKLENINSFGLFSQTLYLWEEIFLGYKIETRSFTNSCAQDETFLAKSIRNYCIFLFFISIGSAIVVRRFYFLTKRK